MERVVVTGLGLVTALGTDVDATWQALLAGAGAVTAPLRHGVHQPATRAVAEVEAEVFDGLRAAHPELPADADARTLFGHAAACAAFTHAGLSVGADDAGIVLGSGPGVHRLEDVAAAMDAGGDVDPQRYCAAGAHPGSLVNVAATAPAESAAAQLGIGGPVHGVTTACSASNHALGLALRMVRDGECPYVIAGGSDSMIDPLGLVFFVLPGASANVDGEPADACKPFDRRRSGLVMGEAAGCVVLESLTHAQARGAPILAELVGFGSSFDAYRVTAPPPDGAGAAAAMSAALADGGLAPTDIDYVHAHGTGTKRNDPAEVAAIREVFGDHADRLAVSSTKGALGHALSGAAAVAFVVAVKAIQEDTVPPTRNLTQPDPQCDLHFVPGMGRVHPVRCALNNSFAFGGQNAVTALRKFEEQQ